MAINDMNQLLKHELGDLLYAERTFLKGLKKMSKEISDPMMKERVVSHAAETEEQIEVLGKAFESLGLKPRAEKCDAAIGLKEEHDSFAEEEQPSKEMLEAFDLGSGLRIEHYERAGYRSAIAIAKVLGNTECAKLLTRNLEQEVAMASFLEQNALTALQKLG
jgi:ferritin-like metal-binding protein YciE